MADLAEPLTGPILKGDRLLYAGEGGTDAATDGRTVVVVNVTDGAHGAWIEIQDEKGEKTWHDEAALRSASTRFDRRRVHAEKLAATQVTLQDEHPGADSTSGNVHRNG